MTRLINWKSVIRIIFEVEYTCLKVTSSYLVFSVDLEIKKISFVECYFVGIFGNLNWRV